MLYTKLLLYFLKVAPVFPEEWQETRELSRAQDSHIFMTLLHMLWVVQPVGSSASIVALAGSSFGLFFF